MFVEVVEVVKVVGLAPRTKVMKVTSSNTVGFMFTG